MDKGIKRAVLTPRGIASMAIGAWAADPAARGVGVLQVRKLADGTAGFYYRYTAADGERVRLPIGAGIDLKEARRLAADLSRRYQSGERDLRDVLEAEKHERQQQKKAAADAEKASEVRRGATLGGLLTAYVEQLRRGKKPSADKVESELWRTVRDAFPSIWKLPAADVTLDDLVRITGRLVKDEKWRQAEKTRSYMRAAYTAAVASRGSAGTADLFAQFTHVSNVARDLSTVHRPQHGEAGQIANSKRALTAAELTAYWHRIKAMKGHHGAVLRFHVLTGAQRCEQLARLTKRGYDVDAKTITLMDGKGRRKRIREHVVPLLPDAVKALEVMAGKTGLFLFSVDGGEHGAVYHTVRGYVAHVAAAMMDAGEVAESFTPGELRITVETRLAAAGVSKETRAHLQSHGLGGVQDAHYDKHTYLDEKRAALETLQRLLTGKVVDTRKR